MWGHPEEQPGRQEGAHSAAKARLFLIDFSIGRREKCWVVGPDSSL